MDGNCWVSSYTPFIAFYESSIWRQYRIICKRTVETSGTTIQQSPNCVNTLLNINWIGNFFVQLLPYAYNRQVHRCAGIMSLVYPWLLSRRLHPYRTFQLLFRAISLNKYWQRSSAYTYYIDYRSCKQERTRRSRRRRHGTKSIPISPCRIYRCVALDSTFMSTDSLYPNLLPRKRPTSFDQCCCWRPSAHFELWKRRHARFQTMKTVYRMWSQLTI